MRTPPPAYDRVARFLHWFMAAALAAQFGLGLWMVGLTYYDPWYNASNRLHEAAGMALLALVLLRLAWRNTRPWPVPLPGHPRWQRITAVSAHALMYAGMLAVPVSGYLISTASGAPIDVYGIFALPAITGRVERMEDYAGQTHEVLAWALMALAALHAAAALSHHFRGRDDTLRRMWSGRHDSTLDTGDPIR